MIIGIDFDNTLVQYDTLLHRCAVERSLIPSSLPVHKTAVRDYIRQAHGEDRWTELQGYAYGERIMEAVPAPGAREFIAACRRAGAQVCIISHKTLHPVRGPQTNLHEAARNWLRVANLLDSVSGLARMEDAFFETTREAKIARIGSQRCDVFIDDLPECLEAPGFPARTRAFLYDPADAHGAWQRTERVRSFTELRTLLGDTMTIQGGI